MVFDSIYMKTSDSIDQWYFVAMGWGEVLWHEGIFWVDCGSCYMELYTITKTHRSALKMGEFHLK